jgi:hypothetical protein
MPHSALCRRALTECVDGAVLDTRMRRVISLAMLCAAVSTAGCGPQRHTWREHVQLQSGEILVIQRSIAFKEYQPIGGGGGGSNTPVSELAIVEPQSAENPARWSHPPLLPMVFDRDPDTREWFIVATFYMCQVWRDLGRPTLPYAEFRYRGGAWVQQPLSEKLIGREANVLVPNQADVARDHTLVSKRKLTSDPLVSARFKRIVPSWETDC